MFLSKRLLNFVPDVVLLDTSTPGSYTAYMLPGVYRITLAAGGGAGASCYYSRTGRSGPGAKGGCGGTVQVDIALPQACTASVTIGAKPYRAHVNMANTGDSARGENGANIAITGIPNLTISCDGGTGGYVVAGTNGVNATATPGVQGGVSVSGSSIIRVNVNSNNTPVISATGTGTLGQLNTNWPEPYTTAMCPGSGGAAGSRSYQVLASGGGVKIRRMA